MAIRVTTLSFGIVFGIIAIGGIFVTVDQSDWLPAEGRVLSTVETCTMKATERGVLSKTTFTQEISCSDVLAFEAMHADKSWTVTHNYQGEVLVSRAGVDTTVEMKLPGKAKPVVGDTLRLMQDPADPTQVTTASNAYWGPIAFSVVGALALLFTWLGLGAPLPSRRVRDEADFGLEMRPAPAYTPPAPAPVVADVSRVRRDLAPRKTFGRRGA